MCVREKELVSVEMPDKRSLHEESYRVGWGVDRDRECTYTVYIYKDVEGERQGMCVKRKRM